MGEKTAVIIISLILIILGAWLNSIDFNTEFNFYKSELKINQEEVQEKLFYSPDQDYHTLFRAFQSGLSFQEENFSNKIYIKNVECKEGIPYYRTLNNCYLNNSKLKTNCLGYTEKNEYGCGFGYVYGFFTDREYWIKGEYQLKPENLIKIKENYYIKFIAYSPKGHDKLITGENLIITPGIIADKSYLTDEEVILYIPYDKDISGFNIINQKNFEFDTHSLMHFLMFILSILPGIIFFLVWNFWGKESEEPNIPETLSMYPNKRKAWEVATMFNRPFSTKSINLIPSMLNEFYNKKRIEILLEKDKTYIKIKRFSQKELDSVEQKFMLILEKIETYSSKKQDFFKLDLDKLPLKVKLNLNELFSDLYKEIKSQKENFFETNTAGITLLISSLITISIVNFALSSFLVGTLVLIFSALILSIILMKTTLFSKFKPGYYKEYLEWKSFKKFLSLSNSIKTYGHKGTIILGEFLVYATALGVAEKVLEELKDQRVITNDDYNRMIILISPDTFDYSIQTNYDSSGHWDSSSSFSSGGFSHAGGGGIGGGGGGGR